VQFMGYTYGVMDDIAGRFGVYKVKTVGDAYLAVAGLPSPRPLRTSDLWPSALARDTRRRAAPGG